MMAFFVAALFQTEENATKQLDREIEGELARCFENKIK
jgi:hypothetical protein